MTKITFKFVQLKLNIQVKSQQKHRTLFKDGGVLYFGWDNRESFPG